jgi:hypothetical protein
MDNSHQMRDKTVAVGFGKRPRPYLLSFQGSARADQPRALQQVPQRVFLCDYLPGSGGLVLLTVVPTSRNRTAGSAEQNLAVTRVGGLRVQVFSFGTPPYHQNRAAAPLVFAPDFSVQIIERAF